jgi:hypothetical protein
VRGAEKVSPKVAWPGLPKQQATLLTCDVLLYCVSALAVKAPIKRAIKANKIFLIVTILKSIRSV